MPRGTRTSRRSPAAKSLDLDGRWQLGTDATYGDWTYVDSTVAFAPTSVTVLSVGPDEAAIRWTFGNHTTGPDGNAGPNPYPFEKTVWLRRGELGYFALVRPLVTLSPDQMFFLEHEIGFGGLFGPGTVTTSTDEVVIPQPQHVRLNAADRTEAAEFVRQGDPLTRSLVPLPGGPLIVPSWTPQDSGSVFIHHVRPLVYGGYLHAAPPGPAPTTRAICESAWREAPFPLPVVRPRDLARCGPAPRTPP